MGAEQPRHPNRVLDSQQENCVSSVPRSAHKGPQVRSVVSGGSMKAEFLAKLCCPTRLCRPGPLLLEAQTVETLAYATGPAEEVREGTVRCPACERSYPIQDYVLSFEQLFPDVLREEATFWSQWYGFMWDRGYAGWFDLKEPFAPYIATGIEVPDPGSLLGVERGGTHSLLADHPLIRDAQWVLDIGCGTGWSSLFLARRGHTVVAFDPSGGNVVLAKRYAIAQGHYIEYMTAAVGYLAFQPAIFDAIFALHSIHHVPHLRQEIAIMRDWLRDGGALAVDEHIQNDPMLEGAWPGRSRPGPRRGLSPAPHPRSRRVTGAARGRSVGAGGSRQHGRDRRRTR